MYTKFTVTYVLRLSVATRRWCSGWKFRSLHRK